MKISNQLIRDIRDALFQAGCKTLCNRIDEEINKNRRRICECFLEYLEDSNLHCHCMQGSCDEAAQKLEEMLDKIAKQSGMEQMYDLKARLNFETLMGCTPYNQMLQPEDAEQLKFLIEKYARQFNGGLYQPADMTAGDIWKFVWR